MDYEKKYKEALERAREIHDGPTATIVTRTWLEQVFPQLEDEDERIRKFLVDILSSGTWRKEWPFSPADCVAYLEKQKEKVAFTDNGTPKSLADEFAEIKRDDHKAEVTQDYSGLTDLERAIHRGFLCAGVENVPVGVIKETAQECLAQMRPVGWEKATIDHLYTLASFIKCCGYEDDGEFLEGVANELKTIHDRPTAEWSEDWREEDIQTRFAFYTYKDEDGVLYLSNVFVEEASRNHGFGTRILRAAEKVAETIGATTISLKVKQDSPANAWYRKNGYGYVAFEDGYDWLEKNLEYMKPNKQEWSEEDDKYRNGIIRNLEYLINMTAEGWVARDIRQRIEWLKSLHPTWKPSEEQMEELNYAIAEWDGGKRLEGLYALRNDLKQL